MDSLLPEGKDWAAAGDVSGGGHGKHAQKEIVMLLLAVHETVVYRGFFDQTVQFFRLVRIVAAICWQKAVEAARTFQAVVYAEKIREHLWQSAHDHASRLKNLLR